MSDRSRHWRRSRGPEYGYGYPDQGYGYAQQGYGYPQQDNGYAHQGYGGGGYPDQGGGYPQQPQGGGYGGYPQQGGGYGGGYPQQGGGYQDPYGGYAGGGNVYGGGHSDYLDDEYDRPSRSSKNKSKKKAKKKKGRSKVAIIMTVILALCLGGAGFVGQKIYASMVTPDYAGEGSGEVTIEVKPGDSGNKMATTLLNAGVIKSTKAFILAWDKNEEQANLIQPGTYKLRKQMSGLAALLMLLDPKSRIAAGLTIPEGLSSFRIFKLLAEKLAIPEADFVAAAKDPIKLGVPASWYVRKDGKAQSKSIEGFLFPDTYEFGEKPTAESVLKRMVERFLEVAGQLKMVEKFSKDSKVSPYQALIVASLAQAEAGKKEDLGKVARVAYNRIYKRKPDQTCACLQMDVTINYSLELAGKDPKESKNMTEAELTDPKNPYNRNAIGLVPTPINNPGKFAMEGATSPPAGNWYYFVAIDKNGTTAFSETYADFCKNNQTAVQNGVLTKSSC